MRFEASRRFESRIKLHPIYSQNAKTKGRKRYVEWGHVRVLSYPVPPTQPPQKTPKPASFLQASRKPHGAHARNIVAATAAPRPLSLYLCQLSSSPFIKVVDLLLLALRLQVLVGAEGQRAADQNDGVQADACRGAVGGRGGGAGLCVALGLGVALLYRVVSLLSFSVVGIGLWGWLGVRFGYVWMYV